MCFSFDDQFSTKTEEHPMAAPTPLLYFSNLFCKTFSAQIYETY